MPFIPHTPEALLPRSDSRNANTTCRGLTANGRPCRRSIVKSSPSPRPPSPFCWQHSNQATLPIQPTIKERTSVDTLVDRLGLLDVGHKKRRTDEKRRPKPKPRSNLALFCCIGESDDAKPARPVKRPPIQRDPSSRTGEFLSLIPKSASPQTTSLLLSELAKPVSDSDDKGYIYMFWLTPETSSPPLDTASSLLSPRQEGQRRTSDVLNTFSIPNKKTILLKIGRAQNVQRRLNQWTRQCGYNLSLIRYYPYHPTLSSTSVNIPRTPRKVPNAHKVERLIHIELNGKRAQGSGKCGVCGREHREWFEVEASRAGVKAVDEVVRRWVDWGERAGR